MGAPLWGPSHGRGRAGSLASATAGSPSVSTLTGSTWTTVIGVPSPARIATAKRYLTQIRREQEGDELTDVVRDRAPPGLRR